VACRTHHVAVLLGEAKNKRRVRRPVRHPREIRLRQVVDPRVAGEGAVGEVGKLDGTPVAEGRTMTAVFSPR
jgi:hypothetical protein